MRTTEECLTALKNGKMLENITGGLVWLEHGVQRTINMGKKRKGREFAFSSPDMWRISRKSKPTALKCCDSSNDLHNIGLLIIGFLMGLSILFMFKAEVPNVDPLLNENACLFQEVSQANHEISELTKHLQYYRSTIRAIKSLGASHAQAITVIRAAEVYNLDPKL